MVNVAQQDKHPEYDTASWETLPFTPINNQVDYRHRHDYIGSQKIYSSVLLSRRLILPFFQKCAIDKAVDPGSIAKCKDKVEWPVHFLE